MLPALFSLLSHCLGPAAAAVSWPLAKLRASMMQFASTALRHLHNIQGGESAPYD